ncbi:IscS subfamily cysteine desulfurase [Coxiella burnetii]|uniref:IscS subfamily cysteine desulfurase n=1 Tax=Coxiella burnetii TaxID=777 RepID=UPI0000ED02FE|nr:IscS subfamily cysteine desulfurase [Coxiella burnetii]ACJ20207.1 cysteine desulfurase [Coxiella burnetii CbuK_Q154]AIT63267.1 Cysteine desulfurase [Coxiella burnetii str. Namibia]ATN85858.1 cysteine desulfurase IscS [Coxiella burnetii str. Schperling]EAX32662.1 IscS subfamily cysteine desulfurase [Coxiella burnetii 'MSU Goat Q177']EDR35549.1 cysteine desulfurase [Coxiella burnetii Q321]
MKLPFYFDYMATTPADPAVVGAMVASLTKEGVFGNSASENHRYGWEARQLIENARESVAKLINADPREIIWTSGATESNNLALKGAASFYRRQGKHIITMSSEHKSVLDTCAHLAFSGFEITTLTPEPNGLLNLEKFEAAIRPDTILASILHVNNETGVIQDIHAISEITRRHGILFHVDAAQSAGKIPIDLQAVSVALMSFSAHKIYGPKGIGALYVRAKPRVRLEPLIHGGGHEKGLRSGTLATHQIIGMGKAFELAKLHLEDDNKHLTQLRDRLWNGLVKLGGLHINGANAPRIPGCLNIRFDGVEGESLLVSLQKVAISSGSACNSASSLPSHVLTAMGLTREEADNSIRISFGRFTTQEEVDGAVEHITEQVNRLRKMSPVWETVKAKVVA